MFLLKKKHQANFESKILLGNNSERILGGPGRSSEVHNHYNLDLGVAFVCSCPVVGPSWLANTAHTDSQLAAVDRSSVQEQMCSRLEQVHRDTSFVEQTG